ncbi:hypothetical protein F511_20897 [Dorcoceras hygrometricum]|uniref:Uncharacterized protein n=1 Tax=Dorcoceras hygrometricum TaxID=472368 RepID=A0A2Z7ARE5_9LAMI|nr:hypothetical protein F511_20897 [Dorcoceras hygrometricum]
MGKGIDQLNLHSDQPGYLKTPQMGNADPRHKSRKTNTRSSLNQSINWKIKSSLYTTHSQSAGGNHRFYDHRGPVSPSQLGGRQLNQVVTTPMIALDFSRHDSSVGQSQRGTQSGTAELTASNQLSPGSKFTAAGFLELKSVQGQSSNQREMLTQKLTLAGGSQISRHEDTKLRVLPPIADSGSLMGSKQ